MPRINRLDVGGLVYYVINHANTRVQVFDKKDDHQRFKESEEEAVR